MKKLSLGAVALVLYLMCGGAALAQTCMTGNYSGQLTWPLNGANVTSDIVLNLDSCAAGNVAGNFYTVVHPMSASSCWYSLNQQNPCASANYPYLMPLSGVCQPTEGGPAFTQYLCSANVCSNALNGHFTTTFHTDQYMRVLVNLNMPGQGLGVDPNCPHMPSNIDLIAYSNSSSCSMGYCLTQFNLYESGAQGTSGHLQFNP